MRRGRAEGKQGQGKCSIIDAGDKTEGGTNERRNK